MNFGEEFAGPVQSVSGTVEKYTLDQKIDWHTVDGRNPAPVGRSFMPLQFHDLQYFVATNSFQLVQGFRNHPQYHWELPFIIKTPIN